MGVAPVNVIPRESVEFVEVQVTVDGTPATDQVEVATTLGDARPTAWQPATVLDGKTGILIAALPPGTYTVWARVLSVPEQPVTRSGQLRIT
jgi:hypothetical protein